MRRCLICRRWRRRRRTRHWRRWRRVSLDRRSQARQSSPTIAAMPDHAIAVLLSGGLDSAVLLGCALDEYPAVHPLYVRMGLAWEGVEQEYLWHFLATLARPALKSLVVLDLPVRDLYGDHWSVTGRGTPDAAAPDEEFYLPGRNVLLLS